jgi:hypothetical protein
MHPSDRIVTHSHAVTTIKHHLWLYAVQVDPSESVNFYQQRGSDVL